MSHEKTQENLQIVYMRDELKMTFLAIAMAQTMSGRKMTESIAARLYRKTKRNFLKAQQEKEEKHEQ